MGWLTTLGGWVSKAVSALGSSSSDSEGSTNYPSSTTQNVYEPDKIKVAEVEQETRLQLADKESERIELMKAAKLEIMQEETELKIALEQSRREGFEQMATSIVKLQETLAVIAEKRLKIIEQGSLDIIRQAETFYQEVQADLSAKSEEFSLTKLPQMLEILERYEEGSAAHKLYSKQVDALVVNQTNLLTQQATSLANRQQTVIEGIIASKKHIMSHTDNITSQLIHQASTQAGLTVNGSAQLQSPEEKEALWLDNNSTAQKLPSPE